MPGVREFEYTPILGWSASRYDKFLTCLRQYYYHYYGKFDPEFPAGKIKHLKNLTSIPMETGSIVHGIIAVILNRLLKTNSEIDRGRFEKFIERQVVHDLSRRAFLEVHYSEMDEVLTSDLLPAVRECLWNFLDSPRLEWVREMALKSGDWMIEPPGYGEARMSGLKVYCKVVFLFAVDERVVILDWKTGKQDVEKHGKQLLGYSAWAMYHLGVSAAGIDPVTGYLRPEYREVCLSPTEVDLNNFMTRMGEETEEMYSFCRDVPQNLPLDREEFPMTGGTGLCRYCSFRELCGRI